MKVLNLVQGSPEWRAARAAHHCASEAPAMMGASKYTKRSDLLRQKAEGQKPEPTAEQQALFDRGHAAEAAIRPHIESLIGEELYPATCAEGTLLASLDGMTMDGETLFEHKLWNEQLEKQIAAYAAGDADLDPHYVWQLEHQLFVTGAKRAYLVCSDGTPDKCVSVIYEPAPGWAGTLIAGWKQFDEDVAHYVPEPAVLPVEKVAVESLPAVSVQVNGSIAVVSNLDLFGDALKDFIARINKAPDTDEDFAAADSAIKTLEKAEAALKAAKAAGMAQVASIDALSRTVDAYDETARQTRLMLTKLVKARKEEIRAAAILKGREKWQAHVDALNQRLARVRLTGTAPDFAGAVKGLRTITSLRSAVDDALARAKIEASQLADDMARNLASVDEIAGAHAFLVRDLQDLVSINPEHLAGVLRGRIAEHECAQAQKLETERQRIREEEQARARRELLDGQPPRPIPESTALTAAQATPMKAAVGARVPASRPSDEAIIEVLALHYRVHESSVIAWLLDMNLNTASRELAKEAA